jgi:rhodanese-related sulfurtransferase
MFFKKSVLFFIMVFNCSLLWANSAREIGSMEFYEITSSAGFSEKILDVRTPFEWNETGTIKNAITINAYDKKLKMKIKKLDKAKTYYIYCHSGVRSLRVQELMTKFGFKSVNVLGGMSGWLKNKLPVSKYTKNNGIFLEWN